MPLANATNNVQRSSVTHSATAADSSGGKTWLDSAAGVAQGGGVDTGLAAYLGAAIGLMDDLAPAVTNSASSVILTPLRYGMLCPCHLVSCQQLASSPKHCALCGGNICSGLNACCFVSMM